MSRLQVYGVLGAAIALLSAAPCVRGNASAEALAGAGDGGAPAATNAPIRLLLDGYVDLAVRYAEASGQFGSGVALAEAQLELARSGAKPQLHLAPQVRTFVDGGSGTDFDLGIDIGDRLLEIPQNITRKKIAKGRISQAGQRALRAREPYAVKAQLAFLSALAAQHTVRLSRGRLNALRTASSAWEAMELNDDEALLDKQAASALAAQQAVEAAADAEALYEACVQQLHSLCGMETGKLELEELPAYAFPDISLARCLSWWQRHRSDLAAAKEQAAMMSEVVRLARYGRWPRARMGVGYDDGHSDTEFDDDPRGVFALFALSVPIWDAGETRARVAEAEARRDAVDAEIELIKTEIPGTVTDAFSQLRAAVHAFQRVRLDPKPARALREAKARFSNSQLSSVELEEAELAWRAHEADVASANRDCYAAEAKLCEALQASRMQLAAGLVEDSVSP